MDKKTFKALGRIIDVVEYIYADDEDTEDGDPMADAAVVRAWMLQQD